ncbi:hypothetical protein, partial [Paracoccus rhizosphaerae]
AGLDMPFSYVAGRAMCIPKRLYATTPLRPIPAAHYAKLFVAGSLCTGCYDGLDAGWLSPQ